MSRRPYLPSLEKLENREVFSAGPLAPLPASVIATGTGQAAWDGDYGFDGVALTAPQSEPSALLQAGFAQGAANLKAVDHPLMDDVALHMILPYVEQDGVYKSSLPFSNTVLDDQAFVSQLYQDILGRAADAVAHDAVFAELGTSELHWPESQEGNQIIAVLIGLLADGSPRGIPAGANRITDVTDGTSNTMMFSALAR
jgi:hypothetical protein